MASKAKPGSNGAGSGAPLLPADAFAETVSADGTLPEVRARALQALRQQPHARSEEDRDLIWEWLTTSAPTKRYFSRCDVCRCAQVLLRPLIPALTPLVGRALVTCFVLLQ